MKIEDIYEPINIKNLSTNELNTLCTDIRSFLINNIAKTGGHLSSNLGIVELTVALHYVFDSPNDKIFFDVGHQSYVHKILTGRSKLFPTLRQTNGLSGFQKKEESIHDVWEAGHSSTALSAATAMAVARDLDGETFDVLPVIGDAAMLGGASLEALNHLSSINSKVIIILNDNEMSIGKRVGNVRNFLTNIQTSDTYNELKEDYRTILNKGIVRSKIYKFTSKLKNNIKNSLVTTNFFDDFGIQYIGPINGHDLNELKKALTFAKKSKTSTIIHVQTIKGKGYKHALFDNDGKWHGTGPFDVNSGKTNNTTDKNYKSWSKVIADEIDRNMKNDRSIIAVTPAMIHGSSMESLFAKYKDRCFDVGIAEQHALTFVAGLSISGKKPFISVYSSFIQRAYDQINHDIARMNLPCLISIDRAGIVGSDGPTHHGVFDISLFNAVPNLVIFAPKNDQEAIGFINYVYRNFDKPYLIRIPRGNTRLTNELITINNVGSWTYNALNTKNDIIIITYGQNVQHIESLCKENNINASIVNARFIKPMDLDLLNKISDLAKPILVYETDLQIGGLFTSISSYLHKCNIKVDLYSIAIDDHYSIQGSIEDIYKDEKIDLDTVLNKIKEILNG